MGVSKPSAYKNYLTPALHRRFTGAAVVIFAICYIEAVFVGEKTSWFWSWFPVGAVAIKTLLLFVSALSVFVLRVAQLRLGPRLTASPSTTFYRQLFRLDSAQTLAWYLFSAWWFSEVYVWSAADSADLGWIELGKSWERRKLNERPIYLRSVFYIFALTQSFLHIYYDYDYIPLPLKEPPKTESIPEEPPGLWVTTKTQLWRQVQPLLPLFWYDGNKIVTAVARNIVLRTIFISGVSPFIYALFLRRVAWKWSLSVAGLIWDVPPSRLSYIPPYYPSLIYRSLKSGFLLVLLFEASNVLFTKYVAKEPLKKKQPFSAESKDPNGSLLTGLRSRREVTLTFALWELSYIAARPSDRRKTLFTDIDRRPGPVTAQVLKICIDSISSIQSRIVLFQNPSALAQTATQQKPAPVETLPRISTPMQHQNILIRPPPPTTPAEKFESNVGSIAKSFGQSSNPGTFKLPSNTSSPSRSLSSLLYSTPTRKLLTQGPSYGNQKPSGGLVGTLNEYTMTFLRSSLGIPFRHTFARRARSIVLGSPTSSLHSLLSSIRSASSIAVASLTEDPYGKVAKDVPQLIGTFVSTIQLIEIFVSKGLPIHWTDVEFQEGTDGSGRKVPEIEFLVREMKIGLRAVIEGFGSFADEIGIGSAEMKAARKIVDSIKDEEGSEVKKRAEEEMVEIR